MKIIYKIKYFILDDYYYRTKFDKISEYEQQIFSTKTDIFATMGMIIINLILLLIDHKDKLFPIWFFTFSPIAVAFTCYFSVILNKLIINKRQLELNNAIKDIDNKHKNV